MVRAIDAPVDAALIEAFRAAGVCFSYDWDEVERGGGWLGELGSIRVLEGTSIEGPSAFYGGPFSPNRWSAPGGLCTLGACSYSHSPLPAGMTVGRYCSIAKGLRFLDFSHPIDWASSSVAFFRPENAPYVPPLRGRLDRLSEEQGSRFSPRPFDPRGGKPYPRIGNDVWIGENVWLGLGVELGDGAIVAANSVVTRDVAPYSIVGGGPAKVIRSRFAPEIVEKLQRSTWWNYAYYEFSDIDVTSPEIFAETVTSRVAEGRMEPWRPKTIVL